jgi:hypothetical protein
MSKGPTFEFEKVFALFDQIGLVLERIGQHGDAIKESLLFSDLLVRALITIVDLALEIVQELKVFARGIIRFQKATLEVVYTNT